MFFFSENDWRPVCGRIHDKWVVFNFAEAYDVIYWWITHDGVDVVLPGYEFSTQICYQTVRGEKEEEKIQVQYIAYFKLR
jgi:hypothetical protein